MIFFRLVKQIEIDATVNPGETKVYYHYLNKDLTDTNGMVIINLLEGDTLLTLVSMNSNSITVKNNGSQANKSTILLLYYPFEREHYLSILR